MKKFAILVINCVPIFAQTTISGGYTGKGVMDNHGATKTLPHRSGTGSPNGRDNCSTVGETYFQTDATAGSNTWGCTTTGTPGTWTLQGGAGGSGGYTALTNTTSSTITTAGYVATTVAIPANTITSSTKALQFNWFGVATNTSGTNKNLAFQVDFCTVSGCGSGTVTHAGNNSGNLAMGTGLTNKGWMTNLNCQVVSVVTTTATLWCQARTSLQTSSNGAATLFNENTATITIDPTVAQYVSLDFGTLAITTLTSYNLYGLIF